MRGLERRGAVLSKILSKEQWVRLGWSGDKRHQLLQRAMLWKGDMKQWDRGGPVETCVRSNHRSGPKSVENGNRKAKMETRKLVRRLLE